MAHVKKPIGGKGSKGASVGANKNDFANMRDHDVVTNFCKKCGAWKGELGQEPDLDMYIKHLCDIYDHIHRVLRDDGTCWVNLGDTYANSGIAGSADEMPKGTKGLAYGRGGTPKGYKSKCLLMVPQRFAIEMIRRGWILRNVIVWHKGNCMPSSAGDRFTVDFEYVYFFTKSKKYWFEPQKEPQKACSVKRAFSKNHLEKRKDKDSPEKGYAISSVDQDKAYTKMRKDIADGKVPTRNKRCVWTVNTVPFKEAHFAVFPPELCETPIKAGCPKDGWVLDPFAGSCTVGMVARKLDRNFIGIDAGKEYLDIALKTRLGQRELKL